MKRKELRKMFQEAWDALDKGDLENGNKLVQQLNNEFTKAMENDFYYHQLTDYN